MDPDPAKQPWIWIHHTTVINKQLSFLQAEDLFHLSSPKAGSKKPEPLFILKKGISINIWPVGWHGVREAT
jgi:hypothetical protein